MHLFVGVNYKEMLITALFCMHVVRDRTDQLDNKDIDTKEFIERNEQHRNYFGQF